MLPTLAARRRVDPSRALVRALARRCVPDGRIFGVEHEFGVFRQGEQIDFREIIHGLSLDAAPLHPTNEHHYLTRRGSAVIADGLVAEVATPPVTLAPGFATRAADWAEACREELGAALPTDLRLVGASTHLNVTVDQRVNDRLAVLYARTFAAALMLLMDQPHSPGLLVRPRPSRLELGGEYVVGEWLTAAAVFAVGSAMAVEDHIRGRTNSIPPFLDVTLEPGRRRYGWYVDRRAYGDDLYGSGRSARLPIASGGTVTAGEYLEQAWARARPHALRHSKPDELERVDLMVAGRMELPLERGSPGETTASSGGLENHPLGIGTRTLSTAEVRLEPRTATWDWVAWEAMTTGGSVVVNVPRRGLEEFRRRFDSGALDGPIRRAVAQRSSLRPLTHVSQTTEGPAFFSAVQMGPALLPNDRYGIGTAPASSARPGKRDLPADTTSSTRSSPGTMIHIGIALLVAGLVLLSQWRGSAVAQGDSQDPRSLIQSIDPIEVDGELWVIVSFQQPLAGGPPLDLFSYFFELVIEVQSGPSATISWQVHDGEQASSAPGPFVLLDDGSVLARVGAGQPADFVGSVSIQSASWVDEETTGAVRSQSRLDFDYSDLLAAGALVDRTVVYDLLNRQPVEAEARTQWGGLATILDEDVSESPPGAATVDDPPGDLHDYYGTFDASRPDVGAVEWSSVEFGSGYPESNRLNRLTSICRDGLGAGAAPICPVDLTSLAAAPGWVFVDITFTGSESVVQAGLAWTEPGSPTYEGPEFDPNTGRNRSVEVVAGPSGYEVGTTTFDGEFAFGPSNDVLAVLRPDGVALIVAADALAGCTNPAVFVLTGGGIDLVPLPETPAGVTTVGVPEPTIESSSTTSSAPPSGADSPTDPGTTSDDGTTGDVDTTPDTVNGDAVDDTDTSTIRAGDDETSPMPWLILMGLGLVSIVVGVQLMRTGGGETAMSVPVISGIEKGTRPVTPLGAK